MKKKILMACAAFAMSCASLANANEGFYVNGLVGANWAHDNSDDEIDVKFKVGDAEALALGYAWECGWRVEGEVAHRHNKFKNFKVDGERYHLGGGLTTWSGMANGYYDINMCCTCFVPYVGAGIGYDSHKGRFRFPGNTDDEGTFKAKKSGFAYQLMAGVAYPICEQIDLSLEYRFHKGRIDVQNHTLGVGLKYFF